MVWSAIFTSRTRLEERISSIDAAFSNDAKDKAIQDAEGIIEAVMLNHTLRDSFDDAKHMLIQQVATDLAAYYAIVFNPTTFVLREKVSLMADMLWASAMRGLALLASPEVIKYLEDL